jgi:hypothetical protein
MNIYKSFLPLYFKTPLVFCKKSGENEYTIAILKARAGIIMEGLLARRNLRSKLGGRLLNL